MAGRVSERGRGPTADSETATSPHSSQHLAYEALVQERLTKLVLGWQRIDELVHEGSGPFSSRCGVVATALVRMDVGECRVDAPLDHPGPRPSIEATAS